MSKSKNEILFKKFKILSCYKMDEHSAVYLANHVYLEKKVFLKVLNTETIPDSSITERFKREAKILAQLDHPNITKVFDFGMYKEHFYISFEYFESKNLRELLRVKNLSNEQKREIFIQLVQGLNFAHKKNIIHRDIKPENILIDEANNVKLTDFGLAQNSLDNLVTQQYSVVGTPAYMSPEQIQGEKLTIQSDLFSLGITASELFSGNNLFLGKDTSETINNIISFDEQSSKVLFLEFSKDIQNVLTGLLAANPKDRFTSCSEVLKLLNIESESSESHSNTNSIKLWLIPSIVIALIIILLSLYILFEPKTLDNKEVEKSVDIIENGIDTVLNKTASFDSPIEEEEQHQNDLLVVNQPDKDILKETITESNSSLRSTSKGKSIELGELYIKCYPWAKVYLNNNFIETTPLTKNISAKSGNYLLTLIHPDYPNYFDSIKITADELVFVEVNLDTLLGYLDCQVYPWSEIYIDGEKKGVTPLDIPIRLNEGDYKLTLKNPLYDSIESTISIRRHDTLRRKFNMTEYTLN
jgi:eukaryotic-like serine/threonine-protein kinase